ncbi:uncharacterized protein LOC110861080 isoform X1 [Folsomia candida]|uniref:Uncharacterized protein n=1 Tax=Folsomia candida TaxID=158441 RepID=A0A226F3Z5_FOLCA|nr:uncharacterized protein LOC110861080 isoform X1 [Folsomia candida]OXA64493.1 hypothetical protein Fcan01_02204 [Folsomia candida]
MPPKKNLKLEDLQSVVNELQEEMKGLRSEVEFLKSRNVQGTSQDTPKAISASKRNLKTPTSTNVNVTSDNTTDSPIFNERTRSEKAKASQTQPSTQEFLKTTLLNKDKQTGMKQGVDLSATMKENTRSQRAGENVLMVPPQTK